MVIAIIVAFVVVIHVQCLVSVYLSLVKIKYSVCEKKNQAILFPVASEHPLSNNIYPGKDFYPEKSQNIAGRN